KWPAGIPGNFSCDGDLEPFADRDRERGDPGLGDVERVLGHDVAYCHVLVVAHRQPPMGHDDPLGGPTDRHSHRLAWPDEHEARGVGFGRIAYPEWQAVEYLVTDRRRPAGSERLPARVAELRQVQRLVISHVMHSSWRLAEQPRRRQDRTEPGPER